VPSENCRFALRSPDEIKFPEKIAEVVGTFNPSTWTSPVDITSPMLDEVAEAVLIRQLHVMSEIAD
jgi:hypothetical protein